jgi:hypothetical protein
VHRDFTRLYQHHNPNSYLRKRQPFNKYIVVDLVMNANANNTSTQAAKEARVSARAVLSVIARSCVTISKASPSLPSVVSLVVVV